MTDGRIVLAGERVRGSGAPLHIIDPALDEVFAEVDTPSAEQIDLAVSRAGDIASELRAVPGNTRADWLQRLADELAKKREFMAALESRNVGKPLAEARLDVDDSISCLQHYAELAAGIDRDQGRIIAEPTPDFQIRVRYEPVGVSALIIPWNFPLLTAIWKLAPAMAAGCACILKPSEFTPLSALELAVLIEECNLPRGTLSVLCGSGPLVGEPLCRHSGVAKISFTGSTATGQKIAGIAAAGYKRTTIEAGGKSAVIVFGDTPVAAAVEWILLGGLFNQGQVCNATSRILVEHTIYEEVLQRVAREASTLVIGPPGRADVQLGPLQNRLQYDKFLRYVQLGKRDGARLLQGGRRHPGYQRGFFVEPAIFDQVTTNSAIWREEVFGPLLCFRPFHLERDAIREANDSPYGLAAAVLTQDPDRADRVAAALDVGCVWHNCNNLAFASGPWGGFKHSGIGRELGRWGLESFQEIKQLTRYRSAKPWGWYLK